MLPPGDSPGSLRMGVCVFRWEGFSNEKKRFLSFLFLKQVIVLIFNFYGHFLSQILEPGTRAKRKARPGVSASATRTRAEEGERLTNRSAGWGRVPPLSAKPRLFPYSPLGVGVCSRLVPPLPLSDRTVDSNISSRTRSLSTLALAELRCVCVRRGRGGWGGPAREARGPGLKGGARP